MQSLEQRGLASLKLLLVVISREDSFHIACQTLNIFTISPASKYSDFFISRPASNLTTLSIEILPTIPLIMDIYEALLLRRAGQYADCTLATCPISESLYGYLPSNPVNLIFVALCALSCLVHVIQGFKNRCWTFMVGFGIGTATETVGK